MTEVTEAQEQATAKLAGIFSSVQEAALARLEAAKVATEKAQEALRPALQSFMEHYPEISQVRWRQYTPHFNDGDTCVFGVHEVEYRVVGKTYDEATGLDEDEDEGWEYLSWKFDEKHGISAETWEGLRAFQTFIYSIQNELLPVFGDHCEVIVNREGVQVEEYEHD